MDDLYGGREEGGVFVEKWWREGEGRRGKERIRFHLVGLL